MELPNPMVILFLGFFSLRYRRQFSIVPLLYFLNRLTISMQCSWKPEDGARSPRIGITDNCKLLCGCLELNSGPL